MEYVQHIRRSIRRTETCWVASLAQAQGIHELGDLGSADENRAIKLNPVE